MNMKPGHRYVLLALAVFLAGAIIFFGHRERSNDSAPFSVSGEHNASIVIPGGTGFGLGESEATKPKGLETLDIPKGLGRSPS